MKILIVCGGNVEGYNFEIHHAFIYDQVEAIKRNFPSAGFEIFSVVGKGISGYLKNIRKINRLVSRTRPDLIHAHGGHIGFLCIFQRHVPVITTFHGSDINYFKTRIISAISSAFSSYSIFVNQKIFKLALFKKKKRSFIVPCGVDLDIFYPMDKNEAKEKLGIRSDPGYILFSSRFDKPVKNYQLAKQALSGIENIKLMEIRDRTRGEVNLLMNGAELLLMTSFSEGSPQVIKEAMACNCPVVSVRAGNSDAIIGNTEGTYICDSYNPGEIRSNIIKALDFNARTNGRERMKRYDNNVIAQMIHDLYKKLIPDDGN